MKIIIEVDENLVRDPTTLPLLCAQDVDDLLLRNMKFPLLYVAESVVLYFDDGSVYTFKDRLAEHGWTYGASSTSY